MAVTFLTNEDEKKYVKTINDTAPDENGNIVVKGEGIAYDNTASGIDATTVQGAIDKLSGGNADQGSGMSATASALLITILRNAVYSTDQSANITALENALASGGGEEPDIPDIPDEPDVPVVNTYTISNELVNVTSNNSVASVTEGASYTATLTAADGYNLDSVTVIMGGVDVTADVYADGVITIPAVTGNVEIVATASAAESEAELITDGLLGYWDLRNPAEVVTKTWHWAYPSNLGSGDLYGSVAGGSQGTASLPTIDSNYGHKGFVIVNGSETYPGNTTLAKFGTEFTFVILTHGAMPVNMFGINGIAGSNIPPRWNFCGQYYNTADAVVNPAHVGSGNGDSAADYNFVVKRVSGSNMKVVVDTSDYEFNGEDYSDFAYWTQSVYTYTSNNDGTVIACAVYDRALSDVEIEEMRAFMKTLEVA